MVNPDNRERGLRAAISNPRVSEEAKQRDREILANEYGENAGKSSSAAPESSATSSTKKASSTGPSSKPESSSNTKKTRRSSSGNASFTASMPPGMEGKDRGHVIRGLKAAIANPNVSEEAKDRDRQKLKELGE
ncbi:Conidiation protein 6-domain-containing protein [Cladorrhinum sp. PSN332]|nr:Conidiation protein 6-domain-containing protein [Cladorrhinum sp. PSN332]